MARKFKEILEKSGKNRSGPPVRNQGGVVADAPKRSRGAPDPAVRKSGTPTRGQPSRSTEPKPDEKFRNIQARTSEREIGFGERDTTAPGSGGISDAEFRKLSRPEQRRLEAKGQAPPPPGGKAGENKASAKWQDDQKNKMVSGEAPAERGEGGDAALGLDASMAPQPGGSPTDQMKQPGEPVEAIPPKEEDLGNLEAKEAWSREEEANPELGDLPPEEQTKQVSEAMMQTDISAAVEEAFGDRALEEPQRLQMNRMPQSYEMKSLTKGSTVQTPMGDITKDPTSGRVSVALSPLAKEKLRQKTKAETKLFGSYPGMTDPNSPPPPINAGMRSFNPFTGSFVNDEKSVLKKYMKGGG